MSRSTLRILLALALVLPLGAWYYGGWATVSVENLPDNLIAGKPTNMTFAVRQHGEELLRGLQPTIEGKFGKAGFDARAVETNRRGYYTVTLNAPSAGDWTFTIKTGFGRGDHESKLTLMPIAAVGSAARPVSFTHEQQGRRLFVAKGCVSCHVNARVEGSGKIPVGPDLTERRFAREYLEQFLANPSVKPATAGKPRMPNLNLKPAEIASLIAFINQSEAERVSVVR